MLASFPRASLIWAIVGNCLCYSTLACKTSGAKTKASTTLGPNETVDLTKYNVNGEDCIESQIDGVSIADQLQKKDFSNFINYPTAPDIGDLSALAKKIPRLELAAILDYTANSYASENQALRLQSLVALNQLKAVIRCTASGLNKIPNFNGLVTRWAALSASDISSQYHPGDVTIMRSFLSTTDGDVDQLPALAKFCANTKYEIQATDGHPVAWMSIVPTEREVLFDPGSEFRVVAVETQQTPFDRNDDKFGACARDNPQRTVIRLEQVPSGTWEQEHPGYSDAPRIGSIATFDELKTQLADAKLAKQGGQLVELYLQGQSPLMQTEGQIKDLLGKMGDLCKSYSSNEDAAWSKQFFLPQCVLKTFSPNNDVSFNALSITGGSTIAFYANGGLAKIQLGAPAIVAGVSVDKGSVSFDESGAPKEFRYLGTDPLNVAGSLVTVPVGSVIGLNDQKNVIKLMLPRDSHSGIVVKGYVISSIGFFPDGTIKSLSTPSNGSSPIGPFSGPNNRLAFYPSGNLRSVRTHALELQDSRLKMNSGTVVEAWFYDGGALATVIAEDDDEANFTYQGSAYFEINLLSDGSLAAYSAPQLPSSMRLPCKSGIVYLGPDGQVEACDRYIYPFTYNGQTISSGRFALDAQGRPQDVSDRKVWNDFINAHGMGF